MVEVQYKVQYKQLQHHRNSRLPPLLQRVRWWMCHWWVKCSSSGPRPPSRRLCRVQNAAQRSVPPWQQEVLKAACEISHGPEAYLPAGNAVPYPMTGLTLPCRHRSHWKKWRTAARSYCSPIVVQQKCLAPSLKMRDLLDSWVFGCLVHSDIFLLRGSERDLHITVFRPAAECDDFSFLKWTNIFPRSEWVCVCLPLPLRLSLRCLTFTKNVTFS